MELRQRRTLAAAEDDEEDFGRIGSAVRNLDVIFPKVKDNVQEEGRSVAGLVSIACYVLIFGLVASETSHFFYGKGSFSYSFKPDTDFTSETDLRIDLAVNTPCGGLTITPETGHLSRPMPLDDTLLKDPTRFEFTPEEQFLWNHLRSVHEHVQRTGLMSLETLDFVDADVEADLQRIADRKQREEYAEIERERAEKKARGEPEERHGNGMMVMMVGSGGMFQLVAANMGGSEEEGTACRVHGTVKAFKGKPQRLQLTLGSGMMVNGIFVHAPGHHHGKHANISHRIERFGFGPHLRGLVFPLAGVEQISERGDDIYHYFVNVVPTRVSLGLLGRRVTAYQYSVQHVKRERTPGTENAHGSVTFEIEFSPVVIDVNLNSITTLDLLIRLCSVVGGVFATSKIAVGLIYAVLGLFDRTPHVATGHTGRENGEERASLIDFARDTVVR